MVRCLNSCGVCVYSLLALVMVSSWITTGIAQRELSKEDNEFCEPRATLVAVNAPSFNAFPFFVTLQRCGGSVYHVSPRSKVCVADESHEVTVKTINLDTRRPDSVLLKNHTSCKEQCKVTEVMCDPELERWDGNQCNCQCKYGDNPPEACPARFKWSKYLCRCECNKLPEVQKCLKEEKLWSYDACGCVCPNRVVNRCKRKGKDLDEKNCQCVEKVVTGALTGIDDKQCVSMVLLFSIIVIEFLLLIFIFDICMYRKASGFLHFLRKSACSSRNNSKNDPPLSPNSQTHDTITYL